MLKPYIIEDKDILRAHSNEWYAKIKESQLSDQVKSEFCYVFIRWLIERFKISSYKEISTMLGPSTPLEETRAYKELIGIGKEEGIGIGEKKGIKIGEKKGAVTSKQEDIYEILEARFGSVAQSIVEKINSINDIEKLRKLLRNASTTESLDKFEEMMDQIFH